MGRLKRFLSGRVPPLKKVLIVESGDRGITEKFLSGFSQNCSQVDVVTCFTGAPANLNAAGGELFNIADYGGREGRARLYAELWQRNYSAVGVICSDQPIMTKWKWAIAAHLPGKLFVINENVDYFWVDRTTWRTVKHFVLFRAGLSGADAVRTLSQLALLPFTVLYLLLYAGFVHLKRKAHT